MKESKLVLEVRQDLSADFFDTAFNTQFDLDIRGSHDVDEMF